MSVIRMIKLFGWEKKIQSQIEEKREAELQWYRKREVLGLINNDIKWVFSPVGRGRANALVKPYTSSNRDDHYLCITYLVVQATSHSIDRIFFNQRI